MAPRDLGAEAPESVSILQEARRLLANVEYDSATFVNGYLWVVRVLLLDFVKKSAPTGLLMVSIAL
jgi:hypothetical protein